jgi:hypothetical protein
MDVCLTLFLPSVSPMDLCFCGGANVGCCPWHGVCTSSKRLRNQWFNVIVVTNGSILNALAWRKKMSRDELLPGFVVAATYVQRKFPSSTVDKAYEFVYFM